MKFAIIGTGIIGASSGKGFYDRSDPRQPQARKLSRYIIDSAEDMTGQVK